jgi:hypothetical protein
MCAQRACGLQILSIFAYKRSQPRLTDSTHHHAHALTMEQRKNTSDELYVLGFIAGLCQQEPRDDVLLDDMLMFLREAQEVRRQRQ